MEDDKKKTENTSHPFSLHAKVLDKIKQGMDADSLKDSFISNLLFSIAKDQFTATDYDLFLSLAFVIRERLMERWIKTQQIYHQKLCKRVYYLSLEYLTGRNLGNAVINLGLEQDVEKGIGELGLKLEELRDQELDAGLGNGGLGRLAACFLDSMATLQIPCHGYGIRYEYGIFNQAIVNGYQMENPDTWLRLRNPWEIGRPEFTFTVKFGGRVEQYHDHKGLLRYKWVDTQDVLAMPYDTPIPGYQNSIVNTLRLWSSKATNEFNLDYFNHGDYLKAISEKFESENISKVLYPNDNNFSGRELRFKQQYFFVSASLQDILRRFKRHSNDFLEIPDQMAIQLNDTHPSIAIPEFMRLLVDEEKLPWEDAWEITVHTFAYTNHTLMPEALETWPVTLFEKLLPRHLQIIFEINHRFLKQVAMKYPGNNDKLRDMSLIEEGNEKKVRMAYLSIIGGHSTNGVAALHTKLLKSTFFNHFYNMFPERFNNKTNGITQRRWLKKCNPELSNLISSKIGEDWVTDLYQLKKILPFTEDNDFIKKWIKVKNINKQKLAELVDKELSIQINPQSMYDVQVKRIHEYKRQLLLLLYAVHRYTQIKASPGSNWVPRTIFFGGKAAPGYFMAKLIIKLIHSVGEVINYDPEVQDKLKVIFLPNYRVSLAEKIIPASDLSEQISTAGKEASGTGNMKFALNGALTMGTMDGANIEILEEVGEDNIFIFGLKAHEIEALKKKGYHPGDFIKKSPSLHNILHLIECGFFSLGNADLFKAIIQSLREWDTFMLMADFESYVEIQEKADLLYKDPVAWTKKCITNVANMGKFSSDRTILEYVKDIWKVKPVKV
ncbi:MAG: glycogen/starch/alpha-glucan phosphorylase [Candidatus Aureabacteria bacterium]|nr:glycogen/starch/alpha-glucan phosphorylase [Candidatus Auribacterota bacterium]